MRRWQCCGRRGVTVGQGSRGGSGRPPISSASSPGTRTSPRRWFTFNNHLFHSTLSKRDRELVTVRIGWVRRGEYEWAQHVRMAKSAGLSDEEVDAIMAGPDSPVWGPRDAALLRVGGRDRGRPLRQRPHLEAAGRGLRPPAADGPGVHHRGLRPDGDGLQHLRPRTRPRPHRVPARGARTRARTSPATSAPAGRTPARPPRTGPAPPSPGSARRGEARSSARC